MKFTSFKLVLTSLLCAALTACGGGYSPGDSEVLLQPHPVATGAGTLTDVAVPTPRQAAARTPDATSFLNWAESAYPSYFPGAQANKTLDVWTYRYYPQTDIYLGTNTSGDVLGLRGQGGGAYESIPLGKISDYGCSVYPSDCAAAAKCTPPLVPLGEICADPAAVAELAALDSLLRPVPESFWTSASIGGGGSGDGGGDDGSAGDGAPIANAPVVLTDNAGHTATTTTDAKGYYRINLTGFTPPFIVKVTRPDGTVWYSGSNQAPTKRGFVTMNLTGLTDKTVGYVADAANVSGGAEKVTPLVLASNPTALQVAKTRISTGLTSPLTYVGLNPATFDPVASRYEAVKTDRYDRLLERLIASKASGNTVVVGTVAGVKESFIDGIGTSASFSPMEGVAAGSDGTLYVADSLNHVIRKISPAGVVSTLAGSGSSGFTDGTGTAASFYKPVSVAVDSGGHVYVADRWNNAIRKISPAGVVSTLAGTGTWGYVDGVGTTASFYNPVGVAVDANGIVYVADRNNVIRKITPAGVVSTLAGSGTVGFANGTGTAATFNDPGGVAVDSSGNVYVADIWNYAIRKITPAGVVSTFSVGDVDRFNSPTGVAVDTSGNVYVADTYNNVIRKITSAGVVSTLAGSTYGLADGSGTSAKFFSPQGVAVDSVGNVYVADTGNSLIRKITATGVVSTHAGSASTGFSNGSGTSATFYLPSGVAIDGNGNAYVADLGNNAVRKITPAGVVSTFAGGSWGYPGDFTPNGVALDSSGNVFVTGTNDNAVRKITPAGVVSILAGSSSRSYGFSNGMGTAASFWGPEGISIDSSGNVFVADSQNHAIRKITPAGVVSTFAGDGISGFINGAGTAARFSVPAGLAIDGSGNLFVAELGNNVIRKITPAGVVSTYAGNGSYGFTDGAGTTASFLYPRGVAADSSGNVFVADSGNHAIRKITAAGVVSTVSGDRTRGYRNDSGSGARFSDPRGVAVDSRGHIFVADTDNNAIRLILP